MIDSFSLLLSHSLLLLMMWRLLSRDDIDFELPASEERRRAADEQGAAGPQDDSTGWLTSRRVDRHDHGTKPRQKNNGDKRTHRGWRDA